MKEGDKSQQATGFFGKLRSYLPERNWKMTLGLGVVAAFLLGPVGVGVVAGAYFASRANDSGVGGKGKSALLMGAGAATCATFTGIGAAIGSAIFPVVGTFIGGAIGLVCGIAAAKVVTAVIKRKYMSPKAPAGQATPAPAESKMHAKESSKGKGKGKAQGEAVSVASPRATPADSRKKTEYKGARLD